MKHLFILIAFFVGGCASNSGVVPAGQNQFLISRQAATGFSGLGDMKAEALRDADDYCRKNARNLKVLSTEESKPPYLFGNFPRVEVQFSCMPN